MKRHLPATSHLEQIITTLDVEDHTQQSKPALGSILGRIVAAYQQAQALEWLTSVFERFTTKELTPRVLILRPTTQTTPAWNPSFTPSRYSTARLEAIHRIHCERDAKIAEIEKNPIVHPAEGVWWDNAPRQQYYYRPPFGGVIPAPGDVVMLDVSHAWYSGRFDLRQVFGTRVVYLAELRAHRGKR